MNFHMSWNKPNFNSRPNLVTIAGDRLKCFVDAVKRIDEMAEYNSMGQRKPVAGFRFFKCDDCKKEWEEKSRDCISPSNDTCPSCFADVQPHFWEKHPEWPVDKSGNLV